MRKALLFLLLTIIVFVLIGLLSPKIAGSAVERIHTFVHDIFWEKQILISGDSRLSDKTIRELLPLDRSTFWWVINNDMIESELKKNAWIEKVDIHPCGSSYFSLWGCFDVSIVERQPAFLIYQDNILWLVGEDGHFISPLTPRLKELLVDKPLKTLKGLYEDRPSTDLFNARFFLVKTAIGVIEERTHKTVRELTLNGSGEIEIVFEKFPYIAVFSGGVNDIDDIKEECLRFMTILSQYSGKEDEIEKIDLAFNKLAVVKVKDTPTPEPGKGKVSTKAGQ